LSDTSVSDPKRLFPDPDPTFQVIPDPGPDPDPFLDPGQNQIYYRAQTKLHIFNKCLKLDCCTVLLTFDVIK